MALWEPGGRRPRGRAGCEAWTASFEKSGAATPKSRPATSLEKPARLEAWAAFLHQPVPPLPGPSAGPGEAPRRGATWAPLLQATTGGRAHVPRDWYCAGPCCPLVHSLASCVLFQ